MIMCPWCMKQDQRVEREELYMGGGLYVYRCPKCGSRMEVKQ
jgi:predicted SprT family Zn-dependent metalloprotease